MITKIIAMIRMNNPIRDQRVHANAPGRLLAVKVAHGLKLLRGRQDRPQSEGSVLADQSELFHHGWLGEPSALKVLLEGPDCRDAK